MPHYFFNSLLGGQKMLDLEGQCLPDLDAAREEAIAGLRDIAADRVRSGEPLDLGDCVQITDADSKPLLIVSLGEVLVAKGS
jgi:hypothetical protein